MSSIFNGRPAEYSAASILAVASPMFSILAKSFSLFQILIKEIFLHFI
jgi:hypothetical protein